LKGGGEPPAQPGRSTAKAIADALGFSLGKLITEAERMQNRR